MKTSEDYMLTSEDHLLTLEDHLEKDAALFPDKVAIICGEESCTYRQLWNRVTDTAASFHSKGQAIPFVASPTIECLVSGKYLAYTILLYLPFWLTVRRGSNGLRSPSMIVTS